jgi:hypothetical protein
MMQPPQPQRASRTRNWRQFRLRSLLVLTTVVAAGLAFYFSAAKRAERAIESLQSSGAEVFYNYQRRGGHSGYSLRVEPPGPVAARQIVGSGFFQDAEWINVAGTPLSVEELAPVAELPSVRQLNLDACNIGDAHLVHLSNLRLVEWLDLKMNHITDAGLVQLRGMQRLETLSLSKNKIQGDGLRHLSGIERLKQLFLHDNPVSDQGLSGIGQLLHLEKLGLAGTNVTDDGLKHLVDLKKLQYLGLTRTDVTPAGVEEMQKTLPNCKIEH